MKQSSKALNQLLNERSKSTGIVCFKDQDKEIFSKTDTESIIKVFCSIGKDLANEIDEAHNPFFSGKCTISVQKNIF